MQGFTGHSYDNTIDLGADTWRHVAFIEQRVPAGVSDGASLVHAAARSEAIDAGLHTSQEGDGVRWLMASDVCKHCTDAACLEVCPTGALFRTEFGTVVVQQDVCNGCGYCVSACPFGVLGRSKADGAVHKCTLCYDRQKGDMAPACAKACPTGSIQFGDLAQQLAQRLPMQHSQASRPATGEPFVGQAGQLLTKILGAIDLTREQVFICNVLKHRPPGNRNPRPEEVEACSPYLIRQLELIKPKVIVAFGTFAAQTLLNSKTPIGQLRGLVHQYHGIPLIVTYHPAALLRNPAWKRPTWEDVKLARRILDSSPRS